MRYRVLKLTAALAISLFLTQGNIAYAHESWFVEQAQHTGERHMFDITGAFVILGAIVLMASAGWINRSRRYCALQDGVSGKLCRFLPGGIEWRIVAFLAAVTLIANAFTGVFLAPNLVLPDGLVTLGGIAQALIGLLLLSQISFLIPGGLVLAVALPLAAVYLAPELLVDYMVEFAALGLALFFWGMGTSRIDRRIGAWLRIKPSRCEHLPVPILRIGVGLTLVILAFHHKLIFPGMALTFLDQYNLNFMPAVGFPEFTNLHFVFAGGVVEATMGILLVLGVATRLVAAAVSSFLLLTMAVLGPAELLGHLPILGITLLLIYRGSGAFSLSRSRQPGELRQEMAQ